MTADRQYPGGTLKHFLIRRSEISLPVPCPASCPQPPAPRPPLSFPVPNGRDQEMYFWAIRNLHEPSFRVTSDLYANQPTGHRHSETQAPGVQNMPDASVIASPGGLRRRNPVPRNKCQQKISPLLNHFRRLPEISAQKNCWCPLLADSGRSWQILSTSVHFFLAFSCNNIKTIVEL